MEGAVGMEIMMGYSRNYDDLWLIIDKTCGKSMEL
jgi:hypothetical protein